jgi:hypothetical protein
VCSSALDKSGELNAGRSGVGAGKGIRPRKPARGREVVSVRQPRRPLHSAAAAANKVTAARLSSSLARKWQCRNNTFAKLSYTVLVLNTDCFLIGPIAFSILVSLHFLATFRSHFSWRPFFCRYDLRALRWISSNAFRPTEPYHFNDTIVKPCGLVIPRGAINIY